LPLRIQERINFFQFKVRDAGLAGASKKRKGLRRSIEGPSKSDENNFNTNLHLVSKFCQPTSCSPLTRAFQPEAGTVSQQNHPAAGRQPSSGKKSDEYT
jgi:hypothetical protein